MGRPSSASSSRTTSKTSGAAGHGDPPVLDGGLDPPRRQGRQERDGVTDHLDHRTGAAGGLEVLEPPAAHHLAGVEDHRAVGDALHLVEHVAGEHHVDAEVVADPADEGEHVVALHRVEAVGGLVEQHQHGVVDDGLGQLHPLALAGGHGAQGPDPLLAQPDLPHHVQARPVASRRGSPWSSATWRTRSMALTSGGSDWCSGE